MSALEFLTSQIRVINVLKDTERTKISIIYHNTRQMTCVLRECKGRDMTDIYRTLKSIRCRALAVVYDCFYENGNTYILEEYLCGSTLEEHIRYKGVFSEKQTAQIICEVCSALEILHGNSPPVIHNDIKLSNIMLCDDGGVKLFDFDISRTYKKRAGQNTELMGTEDYASPEHYGYGQSEPRTDIYSLGVTMHKMLTGESLTASHQPTYRGRLRKIIKKCIEIDPKNRYNSVRSLAKELKAYKKISRKLLLIPVCAIILIAAILPFAFGNMQTPPKTDGTFEAGEYYSASNVVSMTTDADGELLWIEKTEQGYFIKNRKGIQKELDFDLQHVCGLVYNKLSQKLYLFDINCGFTTTVYETSKDFELKKLAEFSENGMRDIKNTSFFSDGIMLSECINSYFDTKTGVMTASHDFDRAYVINDRIYTLSGGSIYENGKSGEVLREIKLPSGYSSIEYPYCDSKALYITATKDLQQFLLRFDGKEFKEIMKIDSEFNGANFEMCTSDDKIWLFSDSRNIINEYTVS